jgi:hypothetical protein
MALKRLVLPASTLIAKVSGSHQRVSESVEDVLDMSVKNISKSLQRIKSRSSELLLAAFIPEICQALRTAKTGF